MTCVYKNQIYSKVPGAMLRSLDAEVTHPTQDISGIANCHTKIWEVHFKALTSSGWWFQPLRKILVN